MSTFWRLFAFLRSLVYASGFVALWTWVALVVRQFDARVAIHLSPTLRPIGYVVAASGALLVMFCIATFSFRGRGTPAPFDPPREFVASGPYRFVRNPMYIGAALIILGSGLVASSLSIAVLSIGFLLFFHLFVVLYEEPALTGEFGESYLDYKRRVGRWWPGGPRG
jgi:protein-S-isoprenylcysteine O-methyltransferase Ste14